MVENIGRARRGKSNWQSFHNAAMFAGGALLGDAAWIGVSAHAPEEIRADSQASYAQLAPIGTPLSKPA